MEKKEYISPELEVIIFDTEDIITTSPVDSKREWDETGIY